MSDNREKAWICSVCGYVHYGPEPPDECPVCGATKDYFEPHVEDTPQTESVAPSLWRCLNCEYIHEGPEPPAYCPVCGATADRFETHVREMATGSHDGGKSRIVIVGAGIAGVSAAEAVRNVSQQAEISLISKEPHLPYYRLNLTRYLAGDVAADELDIHPESWYNDRGIGLQLGTELTSLDPENKQLTLRGGENLSYDKLILTVGSHPFVPSFPGANRENVTVLRTRQHADNILKACHDGMRCVCIGGGILGLETAGALARRGVDVTLVEGYGWLLPRQLNKRGGDLLEKFVISSGITLCKNARVEEIVGDEQVRGVLLADGALLPADLVIITTGVRSNSYIARLANLDVNRGIIVDRHLQTSHPDIYAAGDVAEHRGVTYGLWGPSQFQGSIAGMNASGEPAEFAGIPRSNMLKVLGYDLFSIGQILVEDGSYDIVEAESDGAYHYFVFRDNYMVGAILLGDTSLSAPVKKVVETRIDCSQTLQHGTDVKRLCEFLGGIS